jgi:hypothetical protein
MHLETASIWDALDLSVGGIDKSGGVDSYGGDVSAETRRTCAGGDAAHADLAPTVSRR